MNDSQLAPYASAEEKNWALFAHLSPLFGYMMIPGLGQVLCPLAIWLMKKDESATIAAHAKDSLNFHISMMIWVALAGIASFFLIGIPVLFGLIIFEVVATIIGTVKASKGERWKYPLMLELIK
jgi:uncharacterized Tic20 family protein